MRLSDRVGSVKEDLSLYKLPSFFFCQESEREKNEHLTGSSKKPDKKKRSTIIRRYLCITVAPSRLRGNPFSSQILFTNIRRRRLFRTSISLKKVRCPEDRNTNTGCSEQKIVWCSELDFLVILTSRRNENYKCS